MYLVVQLKCDCADLYSEVNKSITIIIIIIVIIHESVSVVILR